VRRRLRHVTRGIGCNAEIIIQKTNPKRKPSKSHDLYEQYKSATTVREMLALGGRRGDISYDIAHGWIKFKDPELNRRFCGGAAAKEEPPDAGDSDDDEVVPPPKQKKSDQFLTVK